MSNDTNLDQMSEAPKVSVSEFPDSVTKSVDSSVKEDSGVVIENSRYTSTGTKVLDFCLGFFGVGIIWNLIGGGLIFLPSMFPFIPQEISSLIVCLGIIVNLGLLGGVIYLIIWAYKNGRKFLGHGVLAYIIFSYVVMPLVVFGGCLLLIFGYTATSSM